MPGKNVRQTQSDSTSSHDNVPMGKIGYRPLWILKLSIALRAVHQIGAAVFLASYLLDGINGPPRMYTVLTFVSGAALLLAEGMRHRQIYRELSGLSTLVKLILLGLAYHHFYGETVIVVIAFLLASISSHAPKQFRHRLLF